MYRHYLASVTTLFGVLQSVQSSACLEEQVVVQYQPVVFICSGKTTTTTTVDTSTSCVSFTKPPDVTSTVVGLCMTASSCPPVTNTDGCTTHPCTTSITTYPSTPATSQTPTSTGPDSTVTLTQSCTTASSCPPVTNTDGCTTHPCTTSVTTFTSTTTPSVPSNACATMPASCSPSSFTLKYFENPGEPATGYGVSDGKSGVGPNYYLSQTPLDIGSTNTLEVPLINCPAGNNHYNQPSTGSPNYQYYPGLTGSYGGITFNGNNFTLVFTGYYCPSQAGNYTFCVASDNRDAIFVGSDSAFPCGNSGASATSPGATPLLDSWFYSSNPKCGSITLAAGFCYPIRSVYGNWGCPSYNNPVQITRDGQNVTDFSDNLYSDTCSGITV